MNTLHNRRAALSVSLSSTSSAQDKFKLITTYSFYSLHYSTPHHHHPSSSQVEFRFIKYHLIWPTSER